MSTSEMQREQQAQLQSSLWNIANDLRRNMEASEFKNYILGLISIEQTTRLMGDYD
ncbi:MAG: type I restriction-modification system subunit M N-terminal domain-containing protein [Sarcina sp.]